ncbi:hypothetical protein [Pseudomonas sp. Seg1]|nr:hypothetical protein [Pseudomonas sp. Seg1]
MLTERGKALQTMIVALSQWVGESCTHRASWTR